MSYPTNNNCSSQYCTMLSTTSTTLCVLCSFVYTFNWISPADIGSNCKWRLIYFCCRSSPFPSPGMNIKDPSVVQHFLVFIQSSRYQQLWVVITKVEAAGCMGTSWHREIPLDVKFTPLLSGSKPQQVNYTSTARHSPLQKFTLLQFMVPPLTCRVYSIVEMGIT